jgi:hypothetical protein
MRRAPSPTNLVGKAITWQAKRLHLAAAAKNGELVREAAHVVASLTASLDRAVAVFDRRRAAAHAVTRIRSDATVAMLELRVTAMKSIRKAMNRESLAAQR